MGYLNLPSFCCTDYLFRKDIWLISLTELIYTQYSYRPNKPLPVYIVQTAYLFKKDNVIGKFGRGDLQHSYRTMIICSGAMQTMLCPRCTAETYKKDFCFFSMVMQPPVSFCGHRPADISWRGSEVICIFHFGVRKPVSFKIISSVWLCNHQHIVL